MQCHLQWNYRGSVYPDSIILLAVWRKKERRIKSWWPDLNFVNQYRLSYATQHKTKTLSLSVKRASKSVNFAD